MKVAGVVNFVRYQANHLYHSPERTLAILEVFWDFSRRYFFALAFWSLFAAKILHLYAHLYSLPLEKFLLWGPSFFFQDVAILLLFRIFVKKWTGIIAAINAILVLPASLIVSGMAAANFSVYVFTGAEIHWRQAKTFTGNAAALRTLLSGLTGFLIGEALLVAAALFTARPIHSFSGGVLHVLAWPFRWLNARLRPCVEPLLQRFQKRKPQSASLPDPRLYEQIHLEEDTVNENDSGEEGDHLLDPLGNNRTHEFSIPELRRRTDRLLPRILVLTFLFLAVTLRCVRPSDPVYLYLSGTLPLASFFEGGHRDSPVDITGLPRFKYSFLDKKKPFDTPPSWDWLSEPRAGFEDWESINNQSLHYSPQANPLHISNLQQPVLESIRGALHDGSVKIKHVVLLKLESARADTFPIRKGSFLYDRIAESHDDDKIPDDVEKIISNLTRTAEYLTGFDSGFKHDDNIYSNPKAYGGISARNAYTTSTYTLKSLTGTLCGVTPLVADFNREWEYDIYQPCLPHIFDTLSHQKGIASEPNTTDDFTQWPWHSIWMQSVTDSYDHQEELTPALGYKEKLTKEIIEKSSAKHYPVKTKEVNYYGYVDGELREYIRDAIDDAEHDHQRLFLTHLTGTTHHPWGLPNDTYADIMGSTKNHNEDLNRYLNAVGYQDSWLSDILGILEEKGVANETLLVMAGDHGLSLPNDGGITPYDNPHVGSFAVPIVLAHPQLPSLEVSGPVNSNQIVPSILDLLIESKSIPSESTKPAKDILSLYEGQSLLRPLNQEKDGVKNWQFTVMNTGGSWLAVRSGAMPRFRLVIPLVNDVEWRFTDLKTDPNELEPVSRFSLSDLANVIRKEYDEAALHWLYEAAYVANWWVLQNWKMYGYHPSDNDDD